MPLEPWLPIGFVLPDGKTARLPLQAGENWQILETAAQGRALIAESDLACRWITSGLIDPGAWRKIEFGADTLLVLTSTSGQVLTRTGAGPSPLNKNEAMAFAVSLRETRAIDSQSSLHDALYIEQLSRLLPTYSLSAPVSDDLVLGTYLTGGVQISVHATRRMRSILTWLSGAALTEVTEQAGLSNEAGVEFGLEAFEEEKKGFVLAGRPELERFFREHIIEIIEHADRYRKLGVNFPGAVVLHGPSGCGKTFAVDRVIEYLGWPSFSIDASSIGSPYIHETSRKVSEIFDRAIKEAPSIIKIDEMEAFLTSREGAAGSHQHRVEEVGEFLRRIPEAVHSHVLVVAMTNHMEFIDPAILRRGRFDHILQVGMPSREEVEALLRALLSKVPTEAVDYGQLSSRLAGRPLSDVDFVVREGARLAARAGRDSIDGDSLLLAVASSPSRGPEPPRKIGFT